MRILNRAGFGALGGGVLALLFIIIGVIRALFPLAQGQVTVSRGFLIELTIYVAAFIGAGAVIGVLWPISRYRPLRYLLGIVGATIVMGALSIADEGPPMAWSHDQFVGWIGLSLAFGLAAGLGIDRGMRGAA